MATFYLDPVNGSDAADGTTFANRWKTLASGATAARIAPGDTIRIIASPDPNSLGSATWTDASDTVTLATARTLTVENCEAAWTASANVTCTTQTTGRKQGSFLARSAVASGFTTGKISYRTLPATLDLSAYQQISLWVKCSANVAAGGLELRLCTDATGDTVAHTVPIPNGTLPGTGTGWQVVLKDFGAAMNATINSLSLYANSDPGTNSIDLDNIIACKAASDANVLTHLSLIGKNTVGEPEWYPLLSIDDVTIKLGAHNTTAVDSAPRPYSGTTESVTTYARQPLVDVDATSSARRTLTESGAIGAPITYSGGWNRTDMSTQTGETWISGSHNATYCFEATVSLWNTEKIGLAHGTTAGANITTGSYQNPTLVGIVGCGKPVNVSSVRGMTLNVGNVMQNGDALGWTAVAIKANNRIVARRVSGSSGAGVNVAGADAPIVCDIDKIDNSGAQGLNAVAGSSCDVIVRNTTFANNTSGSLGTANNANGSFRILNGTFPSQPTVANTNLFTVYLHKYNGGADDHRILSPASTIQTDATVRHTASGVAWKVTNLSAVAEPFVNELMPRELPLSRFAVAASALVTCKTWVRRDNTGMTIGIKVKGGFIAGVASDVAAEITAAADTWEEISLTFTPTEAGVVELLGYAHATATTYSGWWDDVTITQA